MNWGKIQTGRGGSMKYGNGSRYGKAGIAFFFLLACAAFALWAPKAEAVPGYLTSFTATYPAATTLSSSCLVCHTTAGASPSTRNPYGSAYGNNGHSFTAIANLDSDGDGFTNITEINANTYPGNAASFPAGTNTAPVAVDDGYSVAAGATLTVNAATGVLANDTDAQSNPLTAVLVAAPSSGTLNLSSNGSFTYTPTIASGSVTFTYRANDGSLDSASTATVTITVSAATAAGPLTVTPAGGLTSSGTAGGPFTPPSQSYTITNTGGSPMNWTATKVASWVTLSSAGGTLAAGDTATVEASINAGANSLAAGSYGDNVTFANTTSGTGNTSRPVSLTIDAAAPPTPVTLSSDSGGSCSVAVRTGSGSSAIDGTLILAGLGMTVWGIRILRRRG